MVEFLKGWMTNLVTFIVIITFLEMILPNGNMRRFVNMIIGILLILVIINPFISLLKSNIDIEKEVFMNISEQNTYKPKEDKEFKNIQDKQIVDMYKNQIEKEVRNSLINKTQYVLEKIHIEIEENNDSKEYGSIKKIELIINENKEIKEKENSKNIQIKDIEIDVKTKDIVKDNERLNNEELNNKHTQDIDKITIHISEQLQLDKDKIFIILKNKGVGGEESVRED
ncbi:stage III sporulation protein AF [Gottschalkia acidurici 9a]|uniref:Stage III sporulation protein AF n=1 Tax=Gottschalkia acidurici (strain ATCC 7906 / DSM 604 / BCRC 14475 / CIP 104303 / KCTC 5404 / NCIMB 10678 / 9a) TaxID=1128398 RepID=K0B035_GOTA9|nr:stage III sporulation protein AF [Gottschalkia acidurici]AFS78387.1 stage III sporulation protein AF [Gottschalkia acidurici 9a]